MRRSSLVAVVLACAVALAGCSSDDGPSKVARSTTTVPSTSTASTGSTVTTAVSPSTTVFDGGTTPVSLPVTTGRTALLTAVATAHHPGLDRVTFTFRGTGVPAVDVRYIDRPTADGSGAPVAVEGAAYLQVHMTPASGVDLTGEDPIPTYTGPQRVRGDTTAVTEVVRTGDFEANLTWVAGTRSKVPFRAYVLTAPSRVVVDIAAP